MKKIRLSVLAIILSVFLLVPSVAFAQSPPGIDVDIDIGTPGDADVDIDISAGGDVDVTVDGVDFKATAGLAQSAWDSANAPTNHLWDFGYYWELSGIGPRVEGQISELQQMAGIMLNANAKLITATDQTAIGQRELEARYAALCEETDALRAVSATMSARDDVIWNQLMYGAEAHLAILNDVVDGQVAIIADTQGQIEVLKQETANQRECPDAQQYGRSLRYSRGVCTSVCGGTGRQESQGVNREVHLSFIEWLIVAALIIIIATMVWPWM